MSRAAQVSMPGWVSGTVPAAQASAWQRLMTAIHRWRASLPRHLVHGFWEGELLKRMTARIRHIFLHTSACCQGQSKGMPAGIGA